MILHLEEDRVIELNKTHDYAIVAITKHGVELARNLHTTFQKSDLYYMSKFKTDDEANYQITLFEGNVRFLLASLFQSYKGIIFIFSLGAVVRMIAPLLKDKKTDPAVVVIDEKGQFAISVVSGHIGGANDLTKQVALLLGATPVITTASDVQQTIAVDLLGKSFGWVLEASQMLTKVSASVVNEEHVAIIQESGGKNWWDQDRPLPDTIKKYPTIETALDTEPNAAIIITHRILDDTKLFKNYVIYRPKAIVLGIGCNRGTRLEEIEQVICETLTELQFSIKSVKAICSIDLKKDEVGLLAVTEKYNWDFVCYSANELNSVPIESPSETVFQYTGAYGVSEPAALLYSGAKELSLTKKKSGNVTISVAVIPF